MGIKREIRAAMRQRKKALSEEEITENGIWIGERAYALLAGYEPTTVALYLSMPDEVQTEHLIKLLQSDGRHRLVVPRVEDETTMCFYELRQEGDYEFSDYGIWEPTDDRADEVIPEIVIVPGVAFDRKGGRVGRGKGYYDRYFALHEETIKARIAIGYDLQVLDEVPMDPYDFPMTHLITENELTVIEG